MDKHILTGVSMVALGFSAMGCGGSGPSSGSSGDPTGAASPRAVASTEAGPSVLVEGYVHGTDGDALSGATVCPAVVGTPKNAASCTTTGSDGWFALAAPASEWVAITFDKPGFVSTVRAVQTETSDLTLPGAENVMVPAVQPLTIGGVTADATMGQIAFSVMGASGQDGVPVSVTLGGTSSPQPAIYLDSTGAPAAGATSGTQGVFANVPPGLYALHFGQASATCAPLSLYGWPMTAYQNPGEAAVVIPVLAGYVTVPVAAACESAQ